MLLRGSDLRAQVGGMGGGGGAEITRGDMWGSGRRDSTINRKVWGRILFKSIYTMRVN